MLRTTGSASGQRKLSARNRRLEERGRGILLLHDIHPATVMALPTLLKELKDRGYMWYRLSPTVNSGFRGGADGLIGCQGTLASRASGEHRSGYTGQDGVAPSREEGYERQAPSPVSGQSARAKLLRFHDQRLAAKAVLSRTNASKSRSFRPLRLLLSASRVFFRQCELLHTKLAFAPPSFDHAVQTCFHPLLPGGRTDLSNHRVREHGVVSLSGDCGRRLALVGQ